MQRSLVNNNSQNTFLGYPITEQPQDNTVLFYSEGEFFFAYISETGGIISVVSVGGGADIIHALGGGILSLRSFVASNSNIAVTQLADTIAVGLAQHLQDMQKITFQEDSNIEAVLNDLNFNITDGGSATLKYLYFRTSYNGIGAIAMSINNQARIDVFGEIYFNSVGDGVAFEDKFLTLDGDGKLVRSAITVTSTDTASNLGSGEGVFSAKVLNDFQFKSLSSPDSNILVNANPTDITFQLSPTLEGITDINLAGSNLALNSSNIYAPNLNTITATGDYIGYDPGTQRIGPTTGLYTATAVGSGRSVIASNGPRNLQLRTLTAGNNINMNFSGLGNTEIAVEVATALNDIYNINQTSLNALSIWSPQLTLPNIPAGGGVKNVFVDGSNNVVSGYSCNTVTSATGTSLISLNTISANGQLILKALSPGSNIAFVDNGATISISSSTSPSANFYQSDGTFDDDARTVTALNPGSPASFLNFVGQKVSVSGHPNYDPTNTDQDVDCILGIQSTNGVTKSINAPYNVCSQTVDFSLGSNYGYYRDVFLAYTDIGSTSQTWSFEVELYSLDTSNVVFAGSWKFDVNINQLASTLFHYVKPVETSGCLVGSITPQSLPALYVARTIGYGAGAYYFRFQQLGTGLPAVANYRAFIKDVSRGVGKEFIVLLGTGIGAVPNLLFENPTLLEIDGVGAIPSNLISYKYWGRDITINAHIQFQSAAVNNNGTFGIQFNGVTVLTLRMRSENTNVNVIAAGGYKRLNLVDLLNSGALLINATTSVTFQVLTGSWTQPNQPYRIVISYV